MINIFGPQTKEKYNPITVDSVVKALEDSGHIVKKIEGNIHVVDGLNDFMPKVIAGERPGMVFNMAYGIQGQSRYTHIPAILEMLGVPYVGSGPQAHAVALDKVMSKILFRQHDFSTPDFWVFSSPNEKMDSIKYPVIVKPKMEAVSMGLKVVDNENDLKDAVVFVLETFQQQALVESFIAGREFAVGLLGNGAAQEILPIVEFDLKGDPTAIQTWSEKTQQPLDKICPADIPDDDMKDMYRYAQGAFFALGISDFARIDLRMDKEGTLYLLEINSMASLGMTGSYVHSAKVAGYSYTTLVNRMLDVAAERYFGKDYIQPIKEEKDRLKSQPLRIRARSYIRGHLTTIESNLQHLVEINSHVHNIDGVNALGQWFWSRIQRLGFSKQVFSQVNVGNCLYFSNHESDKNDILIWNHLDNRYTHQEYVYFHSERGRFIGSGVAENKGGLAILLAALSALRYTRRLRRVKCGILLTTDYSLGGSNGKHLIEKFARQSHRVIGLKWGEAHGGIITSCHGTASCLIEFTNDKSGSEENIPNVLMAMSKRMIEIQKLSSEKDDIIVTPTSIEGKTWLGKIPDHGKITVGLHFKELNQGEALMQQIDRITKKGLGKKLHAKVRKEFFRPPMKEDGSITDFYNKVKYLADSLEININPYSRKISTDLCYVPEGAPALDGLGPIGGSTQTPNEYIIQDSLNDRAVLLALIIDKSVGGL
ncbi:M20/M25/M40 family metallo-hydrolase [candidate division KSB1 bacterium]